MIAGRIHFPSPLAGEGAERTRSVGEAGEGLVRPAGRRGADARDPSPGRSPRSNRGSRPPSPARGEGRNMPLARKAPIAVGVRGRARGLRARMTEAERKLWFALRDRRFARFKFRRQVPVGRYIADFICFEARLVIEVDGGQHADSTRDDLRDRWFIANGFRVQRFWNNDVLSNLEGVCTLIAQALDAELAR
jgi:very-short-patch-repair endonuclease